MDRNGLTHSRIPNPLPPPSPPRTRRPLRLFPDAFQFPQPNCQTSPANPRAKCSRARPSARILYSYGSSIVTVNTLKQRFSIFFEMPLGSFQGRTTFNLMLAKWVALAGETTSTPPSTKTPPSSRQPVRIASKSPLLKFRARAASPRDSALAIKRRPCLRR